MIVKIEIPGQDSTARTGGSDLTAGSRPTRRSAFDRDRPSPLSGAPWFAVSAGAHVLVVALLLLFTPAPKAIRPIDPSPHGIMEATQSPEPDGSPERTPDDVVPPDESTAPFVVPEKPEPDPADVMPAPTETSDTLPPDLTPFTPPVAVGLDRGVIGLRVNRARPPLGPDRAESEPSSWFALTIVNVTMPSSSDAPTMRSWPSGINVEPRMRENPTFGHSMSPLPVLTRRL